MSFPWPTKLTEFDGLTVAGHLLETNKQGSAHTALVRSGRPQPPLRTNIPPLQANLQAENLA